MVYLACPFSVDMEYFWDVFESQKRARASQDHCCFGVFRTINLLTPSMIPATSDLGVFPPRGVRLRLLEISFAQGANEESVAVRRGFLEMMDTMPQAVEHLGGGKVSAEIHRPIRERLFGVF